MKYSDSKEVFDFLFDLLSDLKESKTVYGNTCVYFKNNETENKLIIQVNLELICVFLNNNTYAYTYDEFRNDIDELDKKGGLECLARLTNFNHCEIFKK